MPGIKQSTKIMLKCYPGGITWKKESASPVRKPPVTSPTTFQWTKETASVRSLSKSPFLNKESEFESACMQVFLGMN